MNPRTKHEDDLPIRLVEFAKRVGIVAGAVLATGTILGWLYSNTVGPVIAEVRANTSAQSQIVSRIEAMERRQDAMEARRR